MTEELHPLAEPLRTTYKDKTIYKVERPFHRQVVGLMAQGFASTEVAEILGKSRKTIDRVIHQPDQQDRYVRAVAHNVQSEMKAMIEQVAAGSVVRLAEMAESPELRKQNPRLFADVNQSFIDRFLGKPTQHVENHTPNVDQLSDEEQDRRLAELSQRAEPPRHKPVAKASPQSESVPVHIQNSAAKPETNGYGHNEYDE